MGRDAAAGVGHGHHHVPPGFHLGVLLGIAGVERGVGGFDGEAAASGHGVTRVQAQVEQGVLKLGGIDRRPPQPGAAHKFDLDMLAQ